MRLPVNIVVVGGGTGGTLTANLLAKHLASEISDKEVNVFLVSGARQHVFQPGYLEVAFKGNDPSKITRNEKDLVGRRVQFVQEDAERIALKERIVKLESGKNLSFDYLVIATGSIPNPEAIPGLKEGSLNFHTSGAESRKVWDALQQFEQGHLVVGIAGVPHKCPPSPDEAAFLVDDYLRTRKIREKVRLTFVTPYPRPYPAEPMSKIVEPRFEEKGIEVVTFFNVESVDSIKREIYSLEGETVHYDLLIMVPPHRGANVVIKSAIGDRDGWIPTDKNTMRVDGFENVYAIGDATNIPVSKTGVTAHLEAIVAVHNIVSSVRGTSDLYKYNGRINCPFEMGSGKAAFVVGSYDMPVKQIQPTRTRYAMKKTFGRFYWRTLSGNWDWLLSLYFGEVYKVERAEVAN